MFWGTIFWIHNLIGPDIFFELNMLFGPDIFSNIFLDPKFLNPDFLWTQKFSKRKNFSDPTIFWGPTFFWTRNFIAPKNISSPIFFLDPQFLARACGVPVVVIRAVDCWQWRSCHYFHQSFLPPPFYSPIFSAFSPLRPFLIEGVLGSKTYLAKVGLSAQKPRNMHLSRPPRPFWAPLAAILDLAGSVALQAVSECPLCH